MLLIVFVHSLSIWVLLLIFILSYFLFNIMTVQCTSACREKYYVFLLQLEWMEQKPSNLQLIFVPSRRQFAIKCTTPCTNYVSSIRLFTYKYSTPLKKKKIQSVLHSVSFVTAMSNRL